MANHICSNPSSVTSCDHVHHSPKERAFTNGAKQCDHQPTHSYWYSDYPYLYRSSHLLQTYLLLIHFQHCNKYTTDRPVPSLPWTSPPISHSASELSSSSPQPKTKKETSKTLTKDIPAAATSSANQAPRVSLAKAPLRQRNSHPSGAKQTSA